MLPVKCQSRNKWSCAGCLWELMNCHWYKKKKRLSVIWLNMSKTRGSFSSSFYSIKKCSSQVKKAPRKPNISKKKSVKRNQSSLNSSSAVHASTRVGNPTNSRSKVRGWASARLAWVVQTFPAVLLMICFSSNVSFLRASRTKTFLAFFGLVFLGFI